MGYNPWGRKESDTTERLLCVCVCVCIGQYAPVFLPGEPPSLTEKPGRPQSIGSQRVRHYRSDPAHIEARIFCPWQLCPSES